ncbi:MAG: hypothetical protein WDA75_10425 [Candidatus Latescibacterota bacterium]
MIDVGTTCQLFIDDHVVEHREGLERLFHPPTKDPEPVILADRPWEQPGFLGVLGNCVFYDEADGGYRMYYQAYRVFPDLSEFLRPALAVSSDGLRWEKPDLGLAEEDGSRANNLLCSAADPRWQRDWWAYNNVVRDPRDPDPGRRYKALGHGIFDRHLGGAARSGVIVAFSADGLRWTEPPENPVLPNGDTHTLLGWDAGIGRYVAYPRTSRLEGYCSDVRWDPERQELVARGRGPARRCIGRSTSEDFLHWTDPETVLARTPDDPPDYEIYGMPVYRCHDLYLGLPWSFIGAGWEPLDTRLCVSRDGRSWQPVGGQERFLTLGRPGAPDDCYAVAAAPIEVGEELVFYYMGAGFPHGSPYARERRREASVCRARLRLDGYVSLGCRFDSGGELVTRPLRWAGHRLRINADCRRGWLRAELRDAEDRPIPGFTDAECDTFHGDAVSHEVTWGGRGDLTGLIGQPLRVQLQLGDGEVFSLGFGE